MRHVDHLDRLNFDQFKVSVKASDVFGGRVLSSAGKGDRSAPAPWDHRSGWPAQWLCQISHWPGLLLSEGIGDTLRVSLAADPVEEIKVGFDILKSLRIRARGINFIACPTCSRQEFDVIGTVNAWSNVLKTSSPQWTSPSSVVW